jgi:hypothetical protein
MLEQVEIGPSRIVKCNDFPIDHCVLGQIAEGLDDVRVLSVERFPLPGIKIQFGFRVDCDSTVSIEFDFLCGGERYVALTLIGETATSNFAESAT